MENYVTLFGSNFLPLGLNLHSSLMRHSGPFALWVLAMDGLVEKQLEELRLPHVRVIPLREVETPELVAAKASRSFKEYCWTLTPFTHEAVFNRDESAMRVTYVDADLFFFGNPGPLLHELEVSGKQVMITEHAYDPQYDQSTLSGKYCVQFLPVMSGERGMRVIRRWQQQCLEWCHDRREGGRFGDQMYLDEWPSLFSPDVHILQAKENLLAPWNVGMYLSRQCLDFMPIAYHFHGLRIRSTTKARLCSTYHLSKRSRGLYQTYLQELRRSVTRLSQCGIPLQVMDTERRSLLSYIKHVAILREETYASF